MSEMRKGARTGNIESIGRLIARELRQTWARCMKLGCEKRAVKGDDFCREHQMAARSKR